MVQNRLQRLILLIMLSLGTYNSLIGAHLDLSDNEVLFKEAQFQQAIQAALGCQNSITIYFREYFEKLLLKDGINPHELLKSLLDCNDKVPTGGKSGSSFIITKDKRFILKTISKDEFETFQSIFANYFEYLRVSPETLLITFYGLFKVEGLIPRYLLLMPNLIRERTKTTQIYDLKGRARKPNHFNPRMIDDNTLSDPPPFVILKKGQNQILKDIEFLQKEGLLDYSLFMVVKDRVVQGIYLIDFLTRYNWKKQAAHFFKQSIWNEQQLSTIPPDKYASRMKLFVDHCAER